ncbi:unnamed protein product [Arabis nemorensis]|uniref:Uncharacterized protein n=1 Tax=Arabis nemorensis TaxID=586526 RepID=A0A565B192_9BRAS|nr:unnamed protein product [Arabis nemorensis]
MQETNKNSSPLINASSVNELVTKNPMLSPPGLFAPYQQQKHYINNMFQSRMTIELCTQLNLLQERSALCIKARDTFIEEAIEKNRETEMRLKKALAEVEFWKKSSHEKTVLCNDIASRLLTLKKREMRRKKVSERDLAEEAESSSGDNGDDDDLDTASSLMCK